MEEMSPSASVTFRLTNPISETSANHVDFTRIKLLTETANLLSDPVPIRTFNDDLTNQENESDEIMSSGDDYIDASSLSMSIGKEKMGIGDERIMAIGEKSNCKGIKSVFELEYIPLWGSKLVCGKREEMEDAVSVVPRFTEVPIKMFVGDHVFDGASSSLTAHFFGVYDGHGGSQVANYCCDRVHLVLGEELKVAAREMINDSLQVWWEKVFKNCFQKVDDEVGGKINPEIASEPVAPETVGSTAVVVVICSSHIIVANCGDSRAVLYRGKEVVILSNDHKVSRTGKMNMRESRQPEARSYNGTGIVSLVFLAMSRSIGDGYLKPWIIPEPEVTFTARAREDECLVLASDGLWDVMSNEEVCEIARKRILIWHKKNGGSMADRGGCTGADPAAQAAADYLAMAALQKGSKDNASVIVVDLKTQRKFKTTNNINISSRFENPTTKQ